MGCTAIGEEKEIACNTYTEIGTIIIQIQITNIIVKVKSNSCDRNMKEPNMWQKNPDKRNIKYNMKS